MPLMLPSAPSVFSSTCSASTVYPTIEPPAGLLTGTSGCVVEMLLVSLGAGLASVVSVFERAPPLKTFAGSSGDVWPLVILSSSLTGIVL